MKKLLPKIMISMLLVVSVSVAQPSELSADNGVLKVKLDLHEAELLATSHFPAAIEILLMFMMKEDIFNNHIMPVKALTVNLKDNHRSGHLGVGIQSKWAMNLKTARKFLSINKMAIPFM